MKKLVLLIACACFTLAGTSLFAESGQDFRFTSKLDTSTIGPKPVVTDAEGKMTLEIDPAKREIHYVLKVKNIDDVYMAHLHLGSGERQGPIVAWLFPITGRRDVRVVEGEFDGVLAEGTITQKNLEKDVSFDELVEAIRSGETYVNVHTIQYRPGELAGKIVLSDASSSY